MIIVKVFGISDEALKTSHDLLRSRLREEIMQSDFYALPGVDRIRIFLISEFHSDSVQPEVLIGMKRYLPLGNISCPKVGAEHDLGTRLVTAMQTYLPGIAVTFILESVDTKAFCMFHPAKSG